jgi:transcriptional regulator with XRE-family HTH domain
MAKGSGRRRGSTAYNPIDVHVGARLRARRTLVGLSQTVVGDAIGITFQQLQKYEGGSNRISASRLYDLSQILDVDTAYFFDGMDQATQSESPALLSRRKSTRPPKKPTKSEDPLIKRETLELVRAYYKISDPKIRDHVRKLIQSVSDASTKTT